MREQRFPGPALNEAGGQRSKEEKERNRTSQEVEEIEGRRDVEENFQIFVFRRSKAS